MRLVFPWLPHLAITDIARDALHRTAFVVVAAFLL